MKSLAFLAAMVAVWNAGNVRAQEATITVKAENVTNSITRYMTGACLEDVNHQIYGGIYSQMLFGESFQEPEVKPDGVSGMWSSVGGGDATGQFTLESDQPFVGKHSQRIVFQSGQGEIGVENRGLNRRGMYFVGGNPYEGCLWVRSETPTDLYLALESGDGATSYAETRLRCSSATWQRLDFELTPQKTGAAGRFAIKLKDPGAVSLGYAFLQPGAWGRYKDLPVHKYIVDGLLAQGLTILRYGGSMVNAEGYRWKNMIGPRDRRNPYKGTWYPYSTNGWGIVEFIDFCRAADLLPIPVFNMKETPQDMADFVAYVNGESDTPWGRKRTEDGHNDPFGLRYIELGNEERIDEAYWQRFKPIAEAIWEQDPDIIIIVGDFGYAGIIRDPFSFEGNPSGITSLATHQKILALAKAHDRPIWFDIHVANTEPHQPDIAAPQSYVEALASMASGAEFKVCVLEENAGNHSLRRAIGHAHTIVSLKRLGDRVRMLCAANCLQPYLQHDNGWDQGMLFFTPSQVWGQPPYHVTRMISQNYLPLCVETVCQGAPGALDVTATRSEDGAILALLAVNMVDRPISASIAIDGFNASDPEAQVTQITGALDAENTPENPENIAPRRSEWEHRLKTGPTVFTFPEYSFTVLVFN